MFSLCTAGRAGGTADFETGALTEQLTFYLRFLTAAQEQGYRLSNVRIAFAPLGDDEAQDHLQQRVIASIAAQFPGAHLEIDLNQNTRDYYEWVRFRLYATDSQGTEYMVGDGGFTNWTQQLLSDRRERLLTSGIATERLATLFRA